MTTLRAVNLAPFNPLVAHLAPFTATYVKPLSNPFLPDDLQWATVTQFRFHYNASHPLVISNMRRVLNSSATSATTTSSTTAATAAAAASGGGGSGLTGPVTEKEFHKKLPRYPNDGVLLIDVQVRPLNSPGSVRPYTSRHTNPLHHSSTCRCALWPAW